jgi:hypothetical protein
MATQAWRAKRQRANSDDRERVAAIQSLLHVGGVSRQGLQDILRRLQEQPLEGGVNADALQNAELTRFVAVRCTETLTLLDGSTWDWEFCDPAFLVARLLEDSAELQAVFDRAFAHASAEPWDVVVAFDEFTPGNLRKPHNGRKCMVVAFNFLNLGQAAMCKDLGWFIPIVVRSNQIARVRGGFSHMLKVFLRRLFYGPSGLSEGGFALTTAEGVPVLLYGRLRILLSDGDGLRQALDWKGAGSIRCCFKHVNVLKRGSDLAHRRRDFEENTSSDHAKFATMTRVELEDVVALLEVASERRAAGGTAARFEAVQKSLGFGWNPTGLLADPFLRSRIDILEVGTYDWVHTCLQDGVLNVEITLFLNRCRDVVGLRMDTLEGYLKGTFAFPRAAKAKGSQLWHIFDRYHFGGDAERLKCMASELLSLYSLLRHFVETRIGDRPELVAERASYDAACDIIDVILLAKRGTVELGEAARRLREAVVRHLELHKAVYGTEHLKPKHHWMFDVADALERDSRLPSRAWTLVDAFVVERLHLRVKAPIEQIRNTRTLERSILAAVLNEQVRRLHDGGNSGLVGPTVAVGDAFYAKHSEVLSQRVSAGDLLYKGAACGECCACACQNDTHYFVVQVMAFVRAESAHSARWRATEHVEVWAASQCDVAAAWYYDAIDTVILRL